MTCSFLVTYQFTWDPLEKPTPVGFREGEVFCVQMSTCGTPNLCGRTVIMQGDPGHMSAGDMGVLKTMAAHRNVASSQTQQGKGRLLSTGRHGGRLLGRLR